MEKEQTPTLQQLLRLQSDVERQGHHVAVAINPIKEALEKGTDISLEMMSHTKAQIFLAHMQLDELTDLLDSIA
jgi:hypothetical protein